MKPSLGARTCSALENTVGDVVKLRCTEWHAPKPAAPGDGLTTPTGRRYLITKVSPTGRTFTCVILPRGGFKPKIPGSWYIWWWHKVRRA